MGVGLQRLVAYDLALASVAAPARSACSPPAAAAALSTAASAPWALSVVAPALPASFISASLSVLAAGREGRTSSWRRIASVNGTIPARASPLRFSPYLGLSERVMERLADESHDVLLRECGALVEPLLRDAEAVHHELPQLA